MKTYAKEVKRRPQLFPPKIVSDPSLLFHGTTNVAEESIEERGLNWESGRAIPKQQLEGVVSIFQELNWGGFDSGGYAVLAPFSLRHDFSGGDTKPVYLREVPSACLTYTTRDFAGGETMRALRHAISDLRGLLESEQSRSRYWEESCRLFCDRARHFAEAMRMPVVTLENCLYAIEQHRAMHGATVYSDRVMRAKPAPVDLKALTNSMVRIAEIEAKANAAADQYTHGVVYAVQLSQENIERARYSASMGIEVRATIPPNQIVAKAIISEEALQRVPRISIQSEATISNPRLGVVAAIKSNTARQGATAEQEINNETDSICD